jgi:hypothetical protein
MLDAFALDSFDQIAPSTDLLILIFAVRPNMRNAKLMNRQLDYRIYYRIYEAPICGFNCWSPGKKSLKAGQGRARQASVAGLGFPQIRFKLWPAIFDG